MIKLKLVDKDHFICDTICNKTLDHRIRKFWNSRKLYYTESDGAVIILDGDNVVGFFRYLIGTYNCYISLAAQGTYILPVYRKLGLASKMWGKALRNVKPAFVTVSLTSPAATKLINSLAKKHKTVKFYTLKT